MCFGFGNEGFGLALRWFMREACACFVAKSSEMDAELSYGWWANFGAAKPKKYLMIPLNPRLLDPNTALMMNFDDSDMHVYPILLPTTQ